MVWSTYDQIPWRQQQPKLVVPRGAAAECQIRPLAAANEHHRDAAAVNHSSQSRDVKLPLKAAERNVRRR
jgi:hypothetical protein